jgi:hypothetical protein
MEDKLERDLRRLKACTITLSVLCAVVLLAAFSGISGRRRFREIDAERVNIVGPNGQIEMVISNKDSLPGPGNIATGRFGKREGMKAAGILFYDDNGDESGGILAGSQEQKGRSQAGSLLTFDKPGGDQVVGIQAEQLDSERKVGFNVWDQPDVSTDQQIRDGDEARSLPPGPERDALLQEASAHQRVFVGRLVDKSATVVLYDLNGRPRLRMVVGADGQPKIEFLNANGKVTRSLPDDSGRPGN